MDQTPPVMSIRDVLFVGILGVLALSTVMQPGYHFSPHSLSAPNPNATKEQNLYLKLGGLEKIRLLCSAIYDKVRAEGFQFLFPE